MSRGDPVSRAAANDRVVVDLTSADAIDEERRRRWLLGLLGPAAAVLCIMAVLSSLSILDGSVPVQVAVAAVLAGAWYLTYRGHTWAAYLCAAIAIPAALLARPLVTGNANDNVLYVGASAMLLLLLAPRQWTGAVIIGSLATAAALYLGTTDAATVDLGWRALAVTGVVVSCATLLLGTLTLRSTHGALLGAYTARDQARHSADQLVRASSHLEHAVDERTAHLQAVLAESDALVAQLAATALRDHLTGLPNRRYLERELARRISEAARDGGSLTAVLIDLVGFKAVNDCYSHDVGDRVLATAATLLESQLGPTDDVCRFGGDEFVVLTQGPQESTAALITRMTDALAGAVLAEAPDITLGMAHGIAVWSAHQRGDPAVAAAQLMRTAEADLRRRRASAPGLGR